MHRCCFLKLVDNTEIYLLPSMNPDGYSASREGNAIIFHIFARVLKTVDQVRSLLPVKM